MFSTYLSPYLFEKYGRTITCVANEPFDPYDFKGFFQPLRYKNKMYLRDKHTDLGLDSGTLYLYIGPPQINFTSDTKPQISVNGKPYTIDRHELVYFGDKPLYRWAIARPSIRRVLG